MVQFTPVFNLRQCRTCFGYFPSTTTYFYKNKNSPGGINTACKRCHQHQCKKWRERNPERYAEINVASVRQWRIDNPEKFRKLQREQDKKWKEANPERWAEINRRSNRKSHRKNPERSRITSNRYWARKKGAEGTYTQADIDKKYIEQQAKCFYCDCDISNGYEIDHYIPLSKGGSNWPDNLRLACKSCNSAKGGMMPEVFMARRKRLG